MVKVVKSVTASFDVDPQCGFTFLCPNELPIHQGEQIAEQLNAQAQFACYRLVSKDCHPETAPWIAKTRAEVMTPVAGEYPNLDIKWPAHCVIGTKGNQLIPGLPSEADYDFIVTKGTDPLKHPYGACFHDLAETESTGVIEWLHKQQIQVVIVGGLATDYCVKTTVLQLCKAGFQTIVNLSGCRGVDPESTNVACTALRTAGALLITDSNELELL